MGSGFFPRVNTRSGLLVLCAMLGAIASVPQDSLAQQYASKERTNAALGHYARARTMLVQALAEFEQGRKYARPDMLVDPEEWRLSVISRTEELNRILDPRPKVTRDGVRFQANKHLIRRERDRLPVVADGAQDRNTYGEEQRKREMRASRARLEDSALIESATGKKKSAQKPEQKNEAPIQQSADDLLFDEEVDDEAPIVSKKVEPSKSEPSKQAENLRGAPIIEDEEEVVDSRAPIPLENAQRDLFGKAPSAAKNNSLFDEEDAEEEISRAIESALAERVRSEPPVQEKTEDEILEAEILRR